MSALHCAGFYLVVLKVEVLLGIIWHSQKLNQVIPARLEGVSIVVPIVQKPFTIDREYDAVSTALRARFHSLILDFTPLVAFGLRGTY